MTDEIPIYISPEDDVTTVRERLEKTSNRQVTMVIPAQTQLRSLVAWRVLHADARRMGKDVLVVSTDPQIRSLAQAGKFRVAHSQAASISGKSRPPTRPSRTGKGRLTSSQARMQAAKKPSVQLPPDQEDESFDEATPIAKVPSRKKEASSPWYGSPPTKPTSVTDATEPPSEANATSSFPEHNTFSTPLAGAPQPGQIVDIHAENRASPPYRSDSNIQEEEANSEWADQYDYQQAEDIRSSAYYKDEVAPPLVVPQEPHTPQPQPTGQQSFGSLPGSPYRTSPLAQKDGAIEDLPPDYHQLMEDRIPPSPLAEQHGSAYADAFDSDEQNAHERNVEPQDNGDDFQVDYLGEDSGSDVNVYDLPSIVQDTPHHAWSEPLPEEPLESSGPMRTYNKNNAPRASRRENPSTVGIDDPDALPPLPIEDTPTLTMRPEEVVAQRTVPNAGRPTQSKKLPPIALPETPVVPQKSGVKRASQQILSTPPRPKTNVPPRTGTSSGQRRAGPPRVAAPTRKLSSPRSSRRSAAIIIGLVLLLLLAVGIPAFVLPTADVTLKLPAKDYSHTITLKAFPTGQQGNTVNAVPADQLSNSFEATGTGKASSSAKVGTAPATGEVTFTNNSTVLVTVPSGTIVTTSNGTAFSTQAEAVVNTQNSNVGATIQVPIKAQTAGTSGNVPAGSINAIPPDSLNAIVMYNKMNSSDLKLTVTNDQPTASGGVGNTPAIVQKDIDSVKASLHTTLQDQFKAWLAQKTAKGDEAGTLTSSETLENAPTVGQTTTDGTFTAKLKLSVTVLIVRAATLQHASIAQLNQFLLKGGTLPGYTVVDDAKLPVLVQKLKVSNDNKSSITLAYTAAAKVVQSLDIQHVRGLIAGKSIADARKTLQSIQGVQHVDISTGPKLWSGGTPSWISFWSNNITIHLIPEDTVTPRRK